MSADQRLHPIKVVARRTGLTQDVLRAWERRYEAITPARSKGDRRMYSSADIERLTLLRCLTELGRGIGQIARLPLEDLRRLLQEDESHSLPPRSTAGAVAANGSTTAWRQRAGELPSRKGAARPAGPSEQELLEACLDAVLALDAPRLHACLERAYLSMGRIAVLDRILLPLLRDIGDRWRNGSMRVMHEHFAAAVVRTLMESFSIGADAVAGAPLMLAATPAGQIHELGALFTVATAAADGWRTLYLGSSLAAEEIAAAARPSGAQVVALSLIYPPDDARVGREMTRLRSLLPDNVTILVGGAAATAYRDALEAIGAICPGDLSELRAALSQLRAAPR